MILSGKGVRNIQLDMLPVDLLLITIILCVLYEN